MAGGYLPVTWEGPDNQYDFITIVPASAEGFTWMAYQETASGNPLELRVPTEAGDYEIRYLDGYSNETLGSIPLVVTEATAAFTAPTEAVAGSIIILDVTAATATVSAPASVGAGQPFDVTWEGPGNMGDFVTIVPAGTGEGEWGYSIDVGNGSPTELYAPDEPGEYEVRYVTGQLALTLARTPITVR